LLWLQNICKYTYRLALEFTITDSWNAKLPPLYFLYYLYSFVNIVIYKIYYFLFTNIEIYPKNLIRLLVSAPPPNLIHTLLAKWRYILVVSQVYKLKCERRIKTWSYFFLTEWLAFLIRWISVKSRIWDFLNKIGWYAPVLIKLDKYSRYCMETYTILLWSFIIAKK
jgi:hypothetical protein